jgi:spermidine/putrescine transport system permease protein
MKKFRHAKLTSFALLLPALIWLGLFLLAPVALTVMLSFARRGAYGSIVYEWNLQNYSRLLDPLYLGIYWRSVQMALLTVVSCLVLAFPMAIWMARASRQLKVWLLLLVMLPFMTNFIIRAHGIKILLSTHGPIKSLLVALGLMDSSQYLTETVFAVWFGMVTNYLPFMILPLYASLEKFDFSLIEAARDLGASRWRAFRMVLLPLTTKAMLGGSILVFMPALGEFIIPDFLGGARVMLIGNLITEQFLKARDWPFGAALSVVMLTTVLLALGLLSSIGARGKRGA